MNFHRPWTIFALDAEHDAYGMARIAQAHNTCMSELASARAERDIACTALCPPGLDIAAKYANAKRELAAARADAERYRWLRGDVQDDFSTRWSRWRIEHWASPGPTWSDIRGADLDAAIDAALAGEKK